MEKEKSKKTIQYILEQEETDASSENSSDENEEIQNHKVKIKGLTKKQKDKLIENLQTMVDKKFEYFYIKIFILKILLTGTFYWTLTGIFN